jgi:hypothetical protein
MSERVRDGRFYRLVGDAPTINPVAAYPKGGEWRALIELACGHMTNRPQGGGRLRVDGAQRDACSGRGFNARFEMLPPGCGDRQPLTGRHKRWARRGSRAAAPILDEPIDRQRFTVNAGHAFRVGVDRRLDCVDQVELHEVVPATEWTWECKRIDMHRATRHGHGTRERPCRAPLRPSRKKLSDCPCNGSPIDDVAPLHRAAIEGHRAEPLEPDGRPAPWAAAQDGKSSVAGADVDSCGETAPERPRQGR